MQTLSYLCILLIVTAHDTEVNPGPCRPRHPCQLWTLVCVGLGIPVSCEPWSLQAKASLSVVNPGPWRPRHPCQLWTLVIVGRGIPVSYEELNHTGVLWICYACDLPNYSLGHLFTDNSIELSNSFHSLSSLNDENEQLGTPKAASSPLPKYKCNTTHKTNKVRARSLRLLVINCQSIKAKRESLATCIDTHPLHIIIGTGSWLENTIFNSEIFPANFTAFRKDVTQTRWRRVFNALRNDLIGTHQI